MLANYLRLGIAYLMISIPISIIFILIYYGIKFLIVRKVNTTFLKVICQLSWISIVIAILGITGVIHGDYSLTSMFSGNVQYNLIIFEQGLTTATLLNLILFIPYGFLSAIIFKKIRKKMIYGILIGLVFTFAIEFLQTFTGRFVELEDILMNTLGTYIGYCIVIVLLRCKKVEKFIAIAKYID